MPGIIRTWWGRCGLRVRLTLVYVAAMMLVLAAYAASVYAFVNRSVSESLDQQLRQDFIWVGASTYQTPDGAFMLNEPEQLVPEEDLPWVQVWSPEGQLLYQNVEAVLRPVPESQELAARAEDRIVSVSTPDVPMRILSRGGMTYSCTYIPVPCISTDLVIQVGRSEAPMRQELRELLLILVFGLPVGVGVAGLGGYVLARRALVPVERMADRARSITAERLSDRLPVHNPNDELGRLATVFNETLGRLEASFEQMRRFTADVSHELRTPLTAIRSVGEVGLREHRDEKAYRATIGSMLEEVDRLASLVNRLLILSRADTGEAKLSVEAVDLRELAENVVAHLGVLAEEKQQSITIDAAGSPRCLGDRLMLRQALINLVDNAIKYTPAGGRIRIRAAESREGAVVDVTDTGPGVGTEPTAQIFDRFYRANRSDEHDVGGAGLGLAIAKWAIEVNGGTLSLEPGNGSGCTFRMTLPGTTTGPPHDERRVAASTHHG